MTRIFLLVILIFILPISPVSRDTNAFQEEEKNTISGKQHFTLWVIGDPHLQTDLDSDPPYRSLEAAIKDSKLGGDQGGEPFDWDIAIVTGDYTGRLQCPSDRDGQDLIDQFQHSGADPNYFYGVIGNHDADLDYQWFRKWVDPLGENTQHSKVDNKRRPYPTQGEWDHYSFQVGNILFLMLGDRNAGPPPFGRECRRGYPAGRVSDETYLWWVERVESHPNHIIIAVAHHALWNTTIYTDLWEGYQLGAHGAHSWADQVGSSMIYAIGNWTIDGLDENRNYVGERPYGFVTYLREHPGAIDFWIHGHTHARVYPGLRVNGKSDIETRYGVTFVNSGNLTRAHSTGGPPFSRVFYFHENSNKVRIKTYLHTNECGIASEGFYNPAEITIELSKEFQPDP
ncbi:metallophosphoesterase [Acidobacteria bacterium AH-259-G07]|nr:metallophosphoesterase [Acidobacteria bacterium AH-259-G07]